MLAFWMGGATTDVVIAPSTQDRGDAGFKRHSRQQYEARKRRYYEQLQEELNRQLTPAPEQPRKAKAKPRRAAPEPQPITVPLLLPSEAQRIVRDAIAEARLTDERLRSNALIASLTLYAQRLAEEHLAREQDEEDALMLLLLT